MAFFTGIFFKEDEVIIIGSDLFWAEMLRFVTVLLKRVVGWGTVVFIDLFV